jgi:hypothetical protein
MQSFWVITPLHQASREEIEIAIHSFKKFYDGASKRHKGFLKLMLIENGEHLGDILRMIRMLNIEHACQVILQEKAGLPSSALPGSSVMLLPTAVGDTRWIKTAFSAGIPIVTVEGTAQGFLLDNSCGMIINQRRLEERVEAFSDLLTMLYFDPGALLALSKSALKNAKTMLSIREQQYLTKVA